MLLTSTVLAMATAVVSVTSKPCPLLGPVFEAPTNLASCTVLQSALDALHKDLDNATSTGTTPLGPWSASNNSFSIGIFDTTYPDQLFSYQYTSPVLAQSTEGVRKVNQDSIYRVGSLSKLITAYLFMINAGPSYWHDKITTYIPELADAAVNCSAASTLIDCVDWNAITLGAMASHTAGVPRDYSSPAELLDPLTLGPTAAEALGFPHLPKSAIPPCGLLPNEPCSLQDYLAGYIEQSPTFAPATQPIYSNTGYVLLAAALEKITGRSMSDMSAELFTKLHMAHSSYAVPPTLSNAVIPLGPTSGYTAQLGPLTPAGGYFSTLADLTILGQSILNSTLLSPAQTRQWLKPTTFTSSPAAAVGMPWEIARASSLLHDRTLDLYTKTGDVLAYSAHLILAPDYNVGFAILAAGNDTVTVRSLLAEVVAAALFPALEKAARQQAHSKYAGTYKGTDDSGVEFEVMLATQPGLPGLKVEKWQVNGIDTFAQLTGVQADELDVRLYPTNLVQPTSNSTQIAYRAAIATVASERLTGIFTPQCQTWFAVGDPMYGSLSLDEVVFTVDDADGQASALTLEAWRTTLGRSS